MLPPPPALGDHVKTWSPAQLFWIVKHGIKYTGMPAWPALERDDEIWAVVAFLRTLPELDADGYRDLALGQVETASSGGEDLAKTESNPQAVGACARCHGADRLGPTSNLVPLLHGQTAEYLTAALSSYAKGERSSGVMQPIASELDQEAIAQLANYYSRLPVPRQQFPHSAAAATESIDRGRSLATRGKPENGIPPCATCHEGDALPAFPRLKGQPAPYLIGQLQLWRQGYNARSASAAVMAPIAKRLTEQEIEDVAAYYASLTRPQDAGGGR